MGVAGSLHPTRRETGVLRQHSRTVAAAAMAAEEAKKRKEPAASQSQAAGASVIPAVPTTPPQAQVGHPLSVPLTLTPTSTLHSILFSYNIL